MEGTISTPPDTGAATTGPATFSDQSLSWTEDSSASTPAPESTAPANTPAAATVPPVDGSTPDGQPPTAGAPPQERWDTILANARAKAAEEAIAPYAWAKQVDPQEFQQIRKIAAHFTKGDVVTGLQEMIAEARKDPAVEAQIRSFAAKTLAQRSQQTPNQEPQPDLPIQLEDGRVVHLYSGEQLAKREAFLQQQWMQAVEQRLQPFQQTHDTLQAKERALEAKQEIVTFRDREMESSAKWKGMDDPAFRVKVATALSRVPVNSDDPRDVSLAFREAYMSVRDMEDVTLTQRAQSTLLDNLKQKAAASSSVNPGSATASSPRAVTKFSDLPPEAWK